jgi:hypothetical protein
MITGVCDKCGSCVPEHNDAGVIDAMYRGIPAYMNVSRHFLPVVKNGVLICEGSPSRAQYIEGQPRDTRGCGYKQDKEQPWRDAYQKVQEWVNGLM